MADRQTGRQAAGGGGASLLTLLTLPGTTIHVTQSPPPPPPPPATHLLRLHPNSSSPVKYHKCKHITSFFAR